MAGVRFRALLAVASFGIAGCVAPPAAAPRVDVPAAERGGVPPARDGETEALARLRDAPVSAPLLTGNDARLLVDGPATHKAMFAAIAGARDHVHLQSYIVEAGEVGERLARLLERKRGQGVRVHVLYDSLGSRGTPREYFERLQAADIAVCEANPVNPAKESRSANPNNRDHRKVLVVDGRVAFTGGINISGVYSAGSFGSRPRTAPRDGGWRDTHVMMRGPIVGEFQRLFLEAWERHQCGPIAQRAAYFPPTAPAGGWAMRLVGNDPEQGASEMYVALLSALQRAQARAWLTYGYFVPDPETIRTLKEAAARGVDVRLVLPGVSDFWAPLYAGRSHYEDLLVAGVRIFERRDALLHAKTAVIDGVWSSVGSTNLDWRSFVHNYEADVIVLGAPFARRLEDLFARDVERSAEIALADWRGRGPLPRMKEWLARAWEYFL
jgi:cardiolipin synthase